MTVSFFGLEAAPVSSEDGSASNLNRGQSLQGFNHAPVATAVVFKDEVDERRSVHGASSLLNKRGLVLSRVDESGARRANAQHFPRMPWSLERETSSTGTSWQLPST